MKRWEIIAAILVGAGVLLVAWFVLVVLPAQREMIRNAYCLDWASAAVVRYMDDHDGRYPRNWNDLREPFAKVSDGSFSFEEVQSRVAIDFNVNPQGTYDPSFEFVQDISGSGGRWGSPDPNERIRRRIMQQRETAPAP